MSDPQSRLMRRFDDFRLRRVDAGFAAAWLGVPWLPRPLAAGIFDLIGAQVGRNPQTVAQLRLNLDQACGHTLDAEALDDLTVEAVKSYLRYWRETFSMRNWNYQEVVDGFTVSGIEPLHDAVTSGRGAVVALTHSGNWDACGLWARHGPLRARPVAVAERIEPEALYRRFNRYRRDIGIEVVPLTGTGRASTALQQELRAGSVVVLPCDRDLQHNGIPVSLCGRDTTMPAGPALLAAQTDAVLLPLELYFTPRGWGIHIGPPIEVPAAGRLRARVTEATGRIAENFTEYLARRTVDWHMMQPIWPDLVAP